MRGKFKRSICKIEKNQRLLRSLNKIRWIKWAISWRLLEASLLYSMVSSSSEGYCIQYLLRWTIRRFRKSLNWSNTEGFKFLFRWWNFSKSRVDLNFDEFCIEFWPPKLRALRISIAVCHDTQYWPPRKYVSREVIFWNFLQFVAVFWKKILKQPPKFWAFGGSGYFSVANIPNYDIMFKYTRFKIPFSQFFSNSTNFCSFLTNLTYS